MDVNYRFWVEYVTASQPGTVLDFGCGEGAVVHALRAAGIEAYGIDPFYSGMEYGTPLLGTLLAEQSVRAYEPGGPLPFGDDTFDLVISNMVLEHVADLGHVVRELRRVLKPNGVMRHHFPTREVIRDGHVGIPLVHRLPRSKLRTAYVRVLRTAGVGATHGSHVIGGEQPMEWTRCALRWLDDYCYYRPYEDIERAFQMFAIRPAEADYFRFRVGGGILGLLSHSEPVCRLAVRRMAFAAFEMRPLD